MASNKEYIKRHRTWQKYANKELAAGRKPIKFKNWKLESAYIKGISNKTSTNARLRQAGIDWEKDKPSARFKRSKRK